MGFEPQKFFIGVIDFFAILLPGALLTFVLKLFTSSDARLKPVYEQLDGVKGWVAFLVVSYMLGHLGFLLGSVLDEGYDWLRNRTLNAQIKRILRRGRNFSLPVRVLVWIAFKRERNQAVDRVGVIKRQILGGIGAKDSINNFQWSKALLALESPDSLATVQRSEADSKFFRCFVVVLALLIVLSLYFSYSWVAIVSAVLLPFALWRYMDLRLKSTNQAYWSVITLVAGKADLKIPASRRNGKITHAGGVVFRPRRGLSNKYLLVESEKDEDKWELPSGEIEADEDSRKTAIRMVHEATGRWAYIVKELLPKDDAEAAGPQFFLMQQIGRGFKKDRDLRTAWLTTADAEPNLKPESLEILTRVDSLGPTYAQRRPPTRIRRVTIERISKGAKKLTNRKGRK